MKQLVCLGEIVFDIFGEQKRLGGAPLNVAAHAKNLIQFKKMAIEVTLKSALGKDTLGYEAADVISDLKLNPVKQTSQRTTGRVLVHQTSSGSHTFEIEEGCAWEEIESKYFSADLLVFGSLAMKVKHNRDVLLSWVETGTPIRLCDLNIRMPFFDKETAEFCLNAATALKVNDDELDILATYFGLKGEPSELLHQIAEKFSLPIIALTLGPKGAWIYSHGVLSKAGAPEILTFKDTVGAGDSFTACLALGILNEVAPEEILAQGTELASRVCGLRGAFPTGDLIESFYLGL